MGGADVSSSVAAIIEAFTTCRRVLSKVRSKVRLKKFKTKNGAQEQEMYLDESLSRAPMEISNQYASGMTACGQPFGIGDAYAQTLLQATLARLNSGLVDIIHKFLVSKDPSKLKLDYKALSTLSDVSRMETTGALAQLKERMFRAMTAHAMANQRQAPPMANKKAQGRKPKDTPKEYVTGIRHDNQTHWAVVRPRTLKNRQLSSSSNVSSSSNGSNSAASSGGTRKSSGSSTLCGTPPPMPSNAYYTPHAPISPPAVNNPQPKKVQLLQQRAQTPPSKKKQSHPEPNPRLPLNQENLAHIPRIPMISPHEQRHQLWSINAEAGGVPPAAASAVPRRRTERTTDSFYSFTSDSTKLGEIPQHRLLHPYDYEAMDRLNAEAAAAGWANVDAGRPQRVRKSPGLLARMLRIAPMAGIAEA